MHIRPTSDRQDRADLTPGCSSSDLTSKSEKQHRPLYRDLWLCWPRVMVRIGEPRTSPELQVV